MTEAWSPLGGLGPPVLSNPMIVELAERYGRTPDKLCCAGPWSLDWSRYRALPIRERIKQNIDVFDFQLTSSDMAQLSTLDQGEAAAIDSDRFGH